MTGEERTILKCAIDEAVRAKVVVLPADYPHGTWKRLKQKCKCPKCLELQRSSRRKSRYKRSTERYTPGNLLPFCQQIVDAMASTNVALTAAQIGEMVGKQSGRATVPQLRAMMMFGLVEVVHEAVADERPADYRLTARGHEFVGQTAR